MPNPTPMTPPTFVSIDVQIVWSREDGDERGEASGLALAVHLVALVLSLVGSDDGQEVVTLEKLTRCSIAVYVCAKKGNSLLEK